jgi:valyl-tRNA synthetase
MRVPRSQRGGEVVEPLVREQWFVRMQPLAEPALEVPPCTLPRSHISFPFQAGPRAPSHVPFPSLPQP